MTRVQSVERAIALLGKVAHQPTGLVGLAVAVRLPTTTTARLLATLEGVDALRRDGEGVYRIGPAITSLAAPGDLEPSLRGCAYPHMVELVGTLDEAIGLSIPAGDDVVTIAQVDAPRPVQAQDWSDSRWPLHTGGSGLVLMATWPPVELDRYLEGRADALRLRRLVDQARERGVAWSHGDYVAELSSVATAIVDGDGRGVAALYAYGPSYRFPESGTAERVEAALRARAADISRSWCRRTEDRRHA